MQGLALEIYQIAPGDVAWNIPAMSTKAQRKAEAERRARHLYARLARLKPADLTERQWTIKAGVSSSFFTNLKKGSEPSVGLLRLILETVGVSLPEFFVHEADGRLIAAPSEQALAEAFDRVLPGLPKVGKGRDRRAEYLASTVLDVLGLPQRLRANPARPEIPDGDDSEEGTPPRSATK